MIKIQTHCHIKGGSRCALATADDLIKDMLGAGNGGAVITNHYCYNYYKDYPGETQKEKLNYYFSLVRDVEKRAENTGLKIFYGAEVRIKLPDDLFAEYILYGFEEKFLYDNKPLFEYTQEELFRLCDKNGVFMYQAHPFRSGVVTGNPEYMHGAEYFNGHFHHINNNDKARAFCDKHNLIKMSGTDYHGARQPVLGGIYVPDGVNDVFDLAECIFNRQHSIIENEKEYLEYLSKRNS